MAVPPPLIVVAGWLAQGAVNQVGSKIMEQQLNDLGLAESTRSYINRKLHEAVEFLANFIRAEFARQKLSTAMDRLESAFMKLSLYKADKLPLQMDRLEAASNDWTAWKQRRTTFLMC
jgi:hypothetical protein